MTTSQDIHLAIDAVWRIESAKVIACVARMVRDVGLAEDLAQDALVAALESWPRDGVPNNAGAWLTTTAKNRALDRLRRDRVLIRRGLIALDKAQALCVQQGQSLGAYALQAAIAACHARTTADQTDWVSIVALYEALAHTAPSPVVALNRAVAVGMAYGPQAALAIVDELSQNPALQNYQWLPSVRGDLLVKLQRHGKAHAAFEQAAGLTHNEQERALLLARAQSLPED